MSNEFWAARDRNGTLAIFNCEPVEEMSAGRIQFVVPTPAPSHDAKAHVIDRNFLPYINRGEKMKLIPT